MVDVSKIRTDWEDVSEADWQVNNAKAQRNTVTAEPMNALGLGVIEALSQSGTYVARDPLRLNGTQDAADITDFGQYPSGWSDPATVDLMGLPTGAGAGVLEVLKVNDYVTIQRYVTHVNNRTWTRATEPGGWTPWVEQMLVSAGQVFGTTGVADTITHPGFHRNGWPASQSATQNLPAGAGEGVLEVHEITPIILLQKYTAIMPAGVWVRYSVSGEWSAWQAQPSAASIAATYATKAELAEFDPGGATATRGLFEWTRPTPDGGTDTITPLAMDPRVPGRMWSQGTRFAQLGYGPVDGSAFTAVSAGLPTEAIVGLHFSSTHVWALMGPMSPGQGSVWRSPLPAISGWHSLAFTKMFDIAAPPAGITPGGNAYWLYGSIATDPTGQRVMLLEYGTTVTGGPSAYFSDDAGATWTKGHTWTAAKHGHAIRWHDGQWWAQLGDQGFDDLGMWSTPDTGHPFTWARRSTLLMEQGGTAEYGINFFPITVNGAERMVTEADTLRNYGPLFLPTGSETGPRSYVPSAQLPAANAGTMRQLTLDPETGNLYWYHTSEIGTLGDNDSIWMLAPPYTQPILLETFPPTSTPQGNPVIAGDYLWLGRIRVRKELLATQV